MYVCMAQKKHLCLDALSACIIALHMHVCVCVSMYVWLTDTLMLGSALWMHEFALCVFLYMHVCTYDIDFTIFFRLVCVYVLLYFLCDEILSYMQESFYMPRQWQNIYIGWMLVTCIHVNTYIHDVYVCTYCIQKARSTHVHALTQTNIDKHTRTCLPDPWVLTHIYAYTHTCIP